MKLHKVKWLCRLVDCLRKMHWFDYYIWGKSKDYEDFFRNSCEVLLDEQLCLKDIWGITLLSARFGFDRFCALRKEKVYWELFDYFGNADIAGAALGAYKKIPFKRRILNNWRNEIAIWNRYFTKYLNAYFSFSIFLCVKRASPFMILPGLCITWRFTPEKYLQLGFGFGPRYPDICPNRNSKWKFGVGGFFARLTIMEYKSDLEWNPGSIAFRYYEGSC